MHPLTRCSRGRSLALWSSALVIGAALLLLMMPAVYDEMDLSLLSDEEGIDRTIYLLWWAFSGGVALLAFAVTLLRGRPGRLGVGDLLVIFFGVAGPFGLIPALVTLGMTASWLRWRPVVIAFATAVVGVAWDHRLQSAAGPTIDVAASTLALLLATALVGVWVGRRREHAAEQRRSLELEARAVRSEERARIARDLHDSLSHRLSLMSLHAGALAYREDLDRARVAETAGLLQDQAQSATDDLRQVLRVLRDESASIDPGMSVADLIHAARAAGTEVRIDDASRDLADATHSLPTVTAHAVHRTIQEALTNARKHAPGEPVTLRVTEGEGHLRVVVENPNPRHGRPGLGPEVGHGLIGLMERAAQVDGELTVADRDPFTVTLEVPWLT